MAPKHKKHIKKMANLNALVFISARAFFCIFFHQLLEIGRLLLKFLVKHLLDVVVGRVGVGLGCRIVVFANVAKWRQ